MIPISTRLERLAVAAAATFQQLEQMYHFETMFHSILILGTDTSTHTG
jgi:hypothetical protein